MSLVLRVRHSPSVPERGFLSVPEILSGEQTAKLLVEMFTRIPYGLILLLSRIRFKVKEDKKIFFDIFQELQKGFYH